MPYTNTVTLLDTEGGGTTAPVTARLWQLRTVLAADTEYYQDEQGTADITVRKDGSMPAPFSFVRDGSFADVSKDVGLSVQDTPRVSNDTGWLFRSGGFSGSLPTDPIEVITATRTFTAAEVPGLLPPLPLTKGSTTFTSITPTLAAASTSPVVPAGIDFVALGTANLNGAVGFRYTGRLLLTPSSTVALGHAESLAIGVANDAVGFFPVGAADPLTTVLTLPASVATAFVLNALKPVVMRELGPGIRSQIETEINNSVATSVGRALPGAVLPQGVNLSIRSVVITPASIAVRGAVGAFGGVISKLPPIAGGAGGGSTFCAYTALAFSGYALDGFSLLRSIRDTRLSTSPTGRRLTELYYRCGPEVIALMRADGELAARAAAAANELTDVLGQARPISASQRHRYERMLRELASRGSADLRAAVAYTLEADVWRLIQGAASPVRE